MGLRPRGTALVKVAFVHRSYVDYNVETPYTRPVGGSESAMAYLAAELVKLGHDIQLVTNTSAPGRRLGVECLNYKTTLTADFLNAADVVVIMNESCAREMRDKFAVKKPLVLWSQHADDQEPIEGLQFTRERKAWTGMVFVSQYQCNGFYDYYWIPREKCHVIANAISPAFLNVTPAEPWFKTGAAPVLVYMSMPYRGLDVLLDSFPAIRAGVPGTRLKVFSSMARVQAEEGEYAELSRRCMSMDGVDYAGSIGQSALARELSGAAALAYPSTYPEMWCVSAFESAAMGAEVLTTATGALPDVAGRFARMVPFNGDKKQLAVDFAKLTIDTLTDAQRNPDEAARRREARIAHIRNTHVWPARALEWDALLKKIAAQAV